VQLGTRVDGMACMAWHPVHCALVMAWHVVCSVHSHACVRSTVTNPPTPASLEPPYLPPVTIHSIKVPFEVNGLGLKLCEVAALQERPGRVWVRGCLDCTCVRTVFRVHRVYCVQHRRVLDKVTYRLRAFQPAGREQRASAGRAQAAPGRPTAVGEEPSCSAGGTGHIGAAF
jgi:hypothetical protein